MKRGQYLGDERDRSAVVRRIVANSPALSTALEGAYSTGTPVRVVLRCPKGHPVFEVDVDAYEHSGQLVPFLTPHGVGVARQRLPAGGARQVCTARGCPALVDEPGACPEHGGPADDLGWRSRVVCSWHKCQWSTDVRFETVLALVALALEVGNGEARFLH